MTFNLSRLGFHRKKLSAEQVDEAVMLYDAGCSLQQLGLRFGVSRQAMWDLLRRRTTMRPQRRFGANNHFHRGGALADPRAHDELEDAIRRGLMERVYVCAECGESPRGEDGRTLVQAHHDDYNKPLSVRWLCQPCHHQWHAEHSAIPRSKA
jgi:hypothetical protein